MIKRLKANSLLKDGIWQEIIDLYENKLWSVKEIAKKFECSYFPIQKLLKNKGVKIRKLGISKPKSLSKENLEELYIKQGKSLEEVGKILNCCQGTVYNYLKKYDISTRETYEYTRYNLNGREFGSWFVTDEYKIIKGHGRWKALCRECNEYHWVLNRVLTHESSQRCVNCERKKRFNGYKEIRGSYWKTVHRGAIERNFEISITIEYAWEIFLKQDRRCALTNLPIEFGYKQEQTASLDRIDSSKGYIEGNIQWVHKDVNRMKWEYNEDYFIKLCHLIANNFPEKGWY